MNGLGLLNLRFGQMHLRIGLAPIGGGGVDILLGRRLRRQRKLALIVGFGFDEIGVGAGELRLRDGKRGRKILARDFRGILDAGQLALRGGKTGLGGFQIDVVLARIDMDEEIALMDELIVANIERNDGAGDPRRDGHRIAVDIGVVGQFIAGVGEPVIIGDGNQDNGHDDGNDQRNPAPPARMAAAQPLCPRRRFPFGLARSNQVTPLVTLAARGAITPNVFARTAWSAPRMENIRKSRCWCRPFGAKVLQLFRRKLKLQKTS